VSADDDSRDSAEVLAAFIEELRARHARGEFAGQGPWDLGGGVTMKDVQYRVGYWLGRIEAWRAMSPQERTIHRGERRYVAHCLRLLRRRLAERV
jgi:hypothetical protein